MKVLIATDGSDHSKNAIRRAGELFAGKPDVQFRVLSVYEVQAYVGVEPHPMSMEYFERLQSVARDRASACADAAAALIKESFGEETSVDRFVEMGGPAQAIVEMAESWPADMIVVGSHGHGLWGRLTLGSVSDQVVHHAPCSVTVVKDPKLRA